MGHWVEEKMEHKGLKLAYLLPWTYSLVCSQGMPAADGGWGYCDELEEGRLKQKITVTFNKLNWGKED